jgi:mannose-6-phosphate isomerase-like protein (cupin superfamily)
MVEKVYSLVTNEVLHEIYRRSDLQHQSSERVNLGSESDFLQAAAMRIQDKKSFRAHTHLTRSRTIPNLKAHESWVVVSGRVTVHYFDVDDSHLGDFTLMDGDLTITYSGGHGYTVLDENTLVYEFKSGPYEGQAIDKRFIEP